MLKSFITIAITNVKILLSKRKVKELGSGRALDESCHVLWSPATRKSFTQKHVHCHGCLKYIINHFKSIYAS